MTREPLEAGSETNAAVTGPGSAGHSGLRQEASPYALPSPTVLSDSVLPGALQRPS